MDQATFLGQEDPETAERFLDAAEAALFRIGAHPSIGSPRSLQHPCLQGLRMWPVPGFERILIFYLDREPHPEVVRVLHAARDIASLLRQEWTK